MLNLTTLATTPTTQFSILGTYESYGRCLAAFMYA